MSSGDKQFIISRMPTGGFVGRAADGGWILPSTVTAAARFATPADAAAVLKAHFGGRRGAGLRVIAVPAGPPAGHVPPSSKQAPNGP
jgi:hypothetical protein